MFNNLILKKDKNINYLIVLLSAITLFSLISGFICKLLEDDNISYCKSFFIKNLFKESGLLENLQSILLLFSILLLINIFRKLESNNFLKIFIILKILALVYYLGEEISWGQHIFNLKSPEILVEINKQEEINLHNISNLFNQLPRSLVILWCGFLPLFFYFFKKNSSLKSVFRLIFLPNNKLIIVSLIFLILFLPDFIIDKSGIHPGHHKDGSDIEVAFYFDLISFNYVERLSELHELIFCFYFFIYSLSFSDKLKNIKIK